MTYFLAAILGVVQGLTEFLPVSSTAHLLLAERLLDSRAQAPAALNFGPDAGESCSVASLVEQVSDGFGGLPGWRRDDDAQVVPETAELRLDASRARAELGWSPVLGLDEAVRWTVDWYRGHSAGQDVRALTIAQIAEYEERL